MLADSQKSGLSKTLTGIDLIILGISAIVGAGIFVMIGSAVVGTPEHVGAGPALIISIVLAGVICIFPALHNSLSSSPGDISPGDASRFFNHRRRYTRQ